MILSVILMAMYIVEGGFVSIFNGVVVILIVTDQKLRENSELLFIMGLCIGDGIDATGYFNAGIVRLSNVLQERDGQTRNAAECFFTSYVTLFFYGYQVAPLMMLVVSIDRLLAVFAPVWHGSISSFKRLIVMLGVIIWVLIIYCFSCVYVLLRPNLLATNQCFAAEVYGETLFAYVIGQRSLLIIVCVLIYIPIFMKTRQILKRKQGNPRIQRFNTTMTLVVFSALFLLAIPDTLAFFNVFGMSNYQIIFYLIGLNKCIVNIFVYTLRHKELKNRIKALGKKLFWCLNKHKSSAVAMSTVTGDGRFSTIRS
ncbi:hypothetical protein L596_016070 [Steinernema carpocapsae]|uniref:G-protein coupled receptors family 1 profile domain-containing protein n=1 Tax=Steinernema carpocapsae TaxID=34508 RepID=A0A4U5NHV8_STECR|nr:hypothetical protein L596_016070 [Steinernema carpocapsae]